MKDSESSEIIVSISFVVVIIILIIFGVSSEIKNKDRCYNLPINDFYQDVRCKKYVEDLKNE